MTAAVVNGAAAAAAAVRGAWRALPPALHPELTPFKSVVWACTLAIMASFSVLPSRAPASWAGRLVVLGTLTASAAGAVAVVGIGCARHLPAARRHAAAVVPAEACDGALRPWFDAMEATHVRALAAYLSALAALTALRVLRGAVATTPAAAPPAPARARRGKYDSVTFRALGGGMTEVMCRKSRDVTRYVMHTEDVANTAWDL